MVGPAVIAILVGMGGSWAFRELLIKRLRRSHPQEFKDLGEPSGRHLYSIVPRHHEMQIRFWRFVWGGRAFRMKDDVLASLTAALLVSNIVLAVGVVVLLWSVAKSA